MYKLFKLNETTNLTVRNFNKIDANRNFRWAKTFFIFTNALVVIEEFLFHTSIIKNKLMKHLMLLMIYSMTFMKDFVTEIIFLSFNKRNCLAAMWTTFKQDLSLPECMNLNFFFVYKNLNFKSSTST